MTSKTPKRESTQIDKFKEAAREAGTDDSEEHFDEKLKRVAKAPVPTKPAR